MRQAIFVTTRRAASESISRVVPLKRMLSPTSVPITHSVHSLVLPRVGYLQQWQLRL